MPAPLQVHQHQHGVADIPVRVEAPADPDARYEARFNGGVWTALAWTDGHAVGTLREQPVGRGPVEIRRDQAPPFTRIPDVGVGDIFVLAGQSNMVMYAQTERTSTSRSSTMPPEPRPEGWIVPTADPLHRYPGGSIWPPFADHLEAAGIPVMFIAVAEGSTGLVDEPDWAVGGDLWARMLRHVDRGTSGANCVRAVLWHQGENDAYNKVSGSVYEAHLAGFAEALQAPWSCPVPLVAGIIGRVKGADADALEAIREAQRNAIAGSHLILAGPETADLPTYDGVHFGDAAVPTLLARWCRAVAPLYDALPCPPEPSAMARFLAQPRRVAATGVLIASLVLLVGVVLRVRARAA